MIPKHLKGLSLSPPRILSTDVYEEIVELAHKIKEELDQDLEFLKEFIAQ